MRRPLVLLALLLALVACTQDVEDPPRSDDAAAAADAAAACPAELDEPLRAWGAAGFRGAVVVHEGDEAVCEAGYGLADRARGRPFTVDTVVGIGSVSKAFTAAAVLDLVAADRIALDDRAGEHVPGLGGAAADATVEQLLLHTSGLDGGHGQDHEPLDRDAAVAALSEIPAAAPPGTELLYSNSGYTVLALIVEGVTGEPYRDHLVDTVLTLDGDEVVGGFWDGEPAAAGERAVGEGEDGEPSRVDGGFAGPHWALAGNGDLAMSAVALARWTGALFAGEVVAREAVALLEATAFDQGEGTEEVPGWVRVDAERFGEPLYGAAGGGGDLGQDAVTAWLPESGRVVTIVANGGAVGAEDLLAEIGPALVAGDPLPAPEGTAEVDPAALTAAEGTYALDVGDGSLEVRATDDGLTVAATGPDAVAALFPPADDADAAGRRAHEERVAALLRGETAGGREELELLEEDIGPVTDVAVEGTIVADRELRTYVTLTADDTVLAWYAVDDAGGIQAVEITEDRPSLALVPAGVGTYRPAPGTGGGVTVAVTDDALTVTGPAGAVAASRD